MENIINTIIQGDVLEKIRSLPDNFINTCVTSPPYFGLRDYGMDAQIGQEETPSQYIQKLVEVFREVRRTLKDDGTLWVNIGDSYNGSGKAGSNPDYINKHKSFNRFHNKDTIGKPVMLSELKKKDLIGIPWLLAFALRDDGWYLRQDIIWHKPNCMPESVKDRCTSSHEYIFLLSKSKKYYYDYKAISEKSLWAEKDKRAISGPSSGKKFVGSQYKCTKGGVYNEDGLKNKRSVWSVPTKSFKDAHFATFPENLIIDCVKAGSPEGGIVLDPFFGSGTTGVVARKLNRNYIGIELNPSYIAIAENRIYKDLGLFK